MVNEYSHIAESKQLKTDFLCISEIEDRRFVMAAIKSYSKAFSYTRLSKEDRDRLERLIKERKTDGNGLKSNSIVN